MSGQYIIVSSITYAYKSRDILERKGIRVRIERAPSEISDCGCLYAVKILNAPVDRAVRLLDKAHVRIISVGGAENDIS